MHVRNQAEQHKFQYTSSPENNLLWLDAPPLSRSIALLSGHLDTPATASAPVASLSGTMVLPLELIFSFYLKDSTCLQLSSSISCFSPGAFGILIYFSQFMLLSPSIQAGSVSGEIRFSETVRVYCICHRIYIIRQEALLQIFPG